MTFLKKLIAALSGMVLIALVFVPFSQIIMRYIFNAPIVGAEELTRFLLIILVFLAFPLVVMERENIQMSEFREMLPASPRRMVAFVIAFAAFLTAGFIAYVAWTTIFANLKNATPTLKIPFWLFLGATFCGFAIAALQHFLDLRRPPQEETHVI
jgi:TRAP-type C4-dicarboxylate transport system permease small subunit